MSYTVMMDAIHPDAAAIPAATQKVAGYVTGSEDILWTAQDWDRFPKAGHVRIDQSPELALWADGGADVADMESGAASMETVLTQAKVREARGWWSFVYVNQGSLAPLESAASEAGLSKLQVWIADWDLSEAEAAARLTGNVVAVQWASPSSNPHTIVPGGTQTLLEANIDLSVTVPGWFSHMIC
jgi:hypothetical protein